MTLRDTLESDDRFVVGVELVSTRGLISESKAVKARDFGSELAACPTIDWVSITDNAGGNPMLSPAALGKPILYAGKDVVIHLSCKDFNRNGLESEAWHLASEGFYNILTLSGDYPERGIAGGAKPVFDTDSVGLLHMLSEMNRGLKVPSAKGDARLTPTQFFLGAVTTNFKVHENEVIPQLLKLEKKIEQGARFIINQIGYDSRKIDELLLYLRTRKPGASALIGNVYVLNPAVAKLFRSEKIPGVAISDELYGICSARAGSPDRGRSWFQELAAKQVAIYRGLGYRGAYLGGVHSAEAIEEILRIERSFAPEDWREFAREIRYSRPGEFYLWEEHPETGLADASRMNGSYLRSLEQRRPSRNVNLSYHLSKLTHDLLFTPGRGLWNAGKSLCSRSADPMQGPKWMRTIEHLGKTAMFGCKDCGDCSLPDIAFLCPESACAKNQRNGPCGGTRGGKCEVDEMECIWARAYDRLKYEGREQDLLAHAPAIQDQSLRGTSSWANAWLERDHRKQPASAEPSPAKPHIQEANATT